MATGGMWFIGASLPVPTDFQRWLQGLAPLTEEERRAAASPYTCPYDLGK